MRVFKRSIQVATLAALCLVAEKSSAMSQQCLDLYAHGTTAAPLNPAAAPAGKQTKTAKATALKTAPNSASKAAPKTDHLKSGYLLSASEVEQAQLPDADQQTQKKADAYQRQLNEHKISTINHIEWVEKVLKSRYIGWDDQVTRMMSSIKNLVVREDNNDNLPGPIVIPLMTFPGYGKTSLVTDLIKLLAAHPDLAYLEQGANFDHVQLAEETAYLDLEPMSRAGVSKIDPKRPITRVIFYDEMQNLLSMEELLSIKKMDDTSQAVVLERIREKMKLPAKVTIDQLITRRQQMITSIWNIFGNGRAQKLKKRTAADYVDSLERDMTKFKVEEQWAEFRRQEQDAASQMARLVELKAQLAEAKAAVQAHRENTEFATRLQEVNAEYTAANQAASTASNSVRTFNQSGASQPNNPVGVTSFITSRVNDIMTDFPTLLELMKLNSIAELQQNFLADPTTTAQQITKAIANAPRDEYLDYRRMIVFMAGNPTPAMADIFSRAQVDPSSLDPDALNRLARSTSRRITYKFFEGLFDKSEAMKSRLKIDDWALILPFTSNQWAKLIQKRLERTREAFHDTLEKVTYPAAMDLELKLDDSVSDFLQARTVKAVGGPRVFVQNAAGYLSILESNLPLELKNLPKDHRIWKSNRYEVVGDIAENASLPGNDNPNFNYLKTHVKGKSVLVKKWHKIVLVVTFDSATNAFVVREATQEPIRGRFIIAGKNSDNQTSILERDQIRVKDGLELQMSIGEKVDTRTKGDTVRNGPSLTRVRNSYFQAARAVVAMYTFRSAPRVITDANTTADHALPEMWSVSNTENLDYWLAEARALIAGLVIEKLQPQLARNKQSDLTKTELILLATNTLDKIAEEITTRDVYSSFLKEVEAEPANISDLLPKDLADNPIFDYSFEIDRNPSKTGDPLAALREPTKRKILRHIYEDVEKILTKQTKAVDAIAAHLLEKGPVEGDTAQAIVGNYFSTQPKIWNFWRTQTGSDLKNEILVSPIGAAVELKVPSMGSYSYEYKPKSLWSVIKGMFSND